MAKGALELGTGLWTWRGVNTDLEPLGVDIIRQHLHVGKPCVAVQDAAGIALPLPGIVNIYIGISGILHSRGNDLVRGVANIFIRNVVAEEIPTIPTHRWGHGNSRG